MLNLREGFWGGTEAAYDAALAAEALVTQGMKAGVFDRVEEAEPFLRVGDVAVIPVKGPLVNSDSAFLAFFGITTYPSIRRAMVAAATDPSIHKILLDVNSGGGSVSGVVDTAKLISRIHDKVKPVVAFSDGAMASAAYWLGCSAGQVFCSSTAVVGSIGVIMTHVEQTARMEKDGFKPTVIRAGKFKALANPLEVLTDSARSQVQAQLDEVYKVFVTHVADARGVSYEAADKFSQGREYVGAQAVEAGLVEGIAAFDELLSKLQSKKPVDKPAAVYDNGINKNRSASVKPKAVLTEQDIAALAAGATAEQIAAAAIPAAPVAEVPAAEAPAAPAAEAPTAEPAAAAPAAEAAAPAAAEKGASAEIVAFLQTELKARDAQILQLTLDKKVATDKLSGIEASHKSLLDIAVASIGRMQVALGGTAPDLSAAADTEVLAQHAALSTKFAEKFKVGGVAAVGANADAKPPVEKQDPHAQARRAAVQFKKKS
jgi:signal peptide peptidase SppA